MPSASIKRVFKNPRAIFLPPEVAVAVAEGKGFLHHKRQWSVFFSFSLYFIFSAYNGVDQCLRCVFHLLQGIDLVAGGKSKKTKRTAPKSDDIYLKLLVKVGFF